MKEEDTLTPALSREREREQGSARPAGGPDGSRMPQPVPQRR